MMKTHGINHLNGFIKNYVALGCVELLVGERYFYIGQEAALGGEAF